MSWGVVAWTRPQIQNDPKYVQCGRCKHYIQTADWDRHAGSCLSARQAVAS